ncbi:hypothetical protein Tco_0269047 [Tanacetum coccineum]
MYPPTTSESSAGNSSFESSARPSRNRYRSPTATDSVEEDIDTDVLADIEADAMVDEVAVDRDVEAGVDAGVARLISVMVMLMPECSERLEQVLVGFVGIISFIEIPLQRIEDIEIGQRELEARSLIYGGERASLLEQVASLKRSTNMTITRSSMTPKAIKELVNRRVEEALAAYEATRAANALEAESQSQNGSDGDNGNGGNRNGGDGNVSLRSLVTCLGLGFARSFTAPRPHGTYFPTTVILSSLAFYSSSLPLLLVTLFYLLSFSFLLLAYRFLLSYDCFLLATCNKHETYETFYLLLATDYATTFLLANLLRSLAILLHSFTLLLAIFQLSNIPCCCVLMLTRCDQKDLMHAFFFAA